jgi:hypothetical protein
MAVILQMTYQKKLGLPNYSSHSCAVSLTVEIPDVSVAAQESTKLYSLLQTAVDNEIQQVGFMADATTCGMNNGNKPLSNGQPSSGNGNGNGHPSNPTPPNGDRWNCTDGQMGFILRIVSESSLKKQDVENRRARRHPGGGLYRLAAQVQAGAGHMRGMSTIRISRKHAKVCVRRRSK